VLCPDLELAPAFGIFWIKTAFLCMKKLNQISLAVPISSAFIGLSFLLVGCVGSSEKFFTLDERHPASPTGVSDTNSAPKPLLMSGTQVLTSLPAPSVDASSQSGHEGHSAPAANLPGAKTAHVHDHGKEAK